MFCAFCLLENHVKRAIDGPRGSIAPSDLNRNLRLISKSLRPGRQEDAHEFLRRLVEACLGNNPKEAANFSNFLTSLLGGKFRSRITCTVCQTNSDTFDPFMDVSLEVAGGMNSLADCLRKFTSVEVLSGSNGYKCKSCDKKVTANKQFTLDVLPPVVTFQLKRFDFSQRKLHRKIQFPVQIDLAPFSAAKRPAVYELSSVVVHAGGSLNSGHYYAYVKSPSGVWLRMDDDITQNVSVNEVLAEASGAYLLFYANSDVSRTETSPVSESTSPGPSIDEPESSRPSSPAADFIIQRLTSAESPLEKPRPPNSSHLRRLCREEEKPEEEKQPIAEAHRSSRAAEVTCWSDQEETDRVSSFKMDHKPIVRSEYDAEYDKSTKLTHKPKGAKMDAHFDGRALFDHAESFNARRKDFIQKHDRPNKRHRR
jgi:ubiquitin carboxyl-terminal hydrolase 36/42